MVDRMKNMFTSLFFCDMMHIQFLKSIEAPARELVDPEFDFIVSLIAFV